MVSFAHRRRRTTSLKSRVSRSLIPRHSMRGERLLKENDDIDLEMGGDENIFANSNKIPSSEKNTPTTNFATNQGPSRSPILITRKGL
jgi:hypothetical protein